MSRGAALLAVVLLLAACKGPEAPSTSGRDAYGFHAAIDATGSEPVYRLDVGPDLQRWLDAHGVGNVAVFDAAGKPQSCGTFNARSFGPLESTAVVSQGRIAPFDDATCRPYGEPAVCFRGRSCDVPAYCPRTPIDLTRSSELTGVDTLARLVEIANRTPDPCDIDDASCPDGPSGDDARAHQRLARRAARAALDRAGLGALLKPDPPPPPRTTPGNFNPRFSATGGGVRSALGAMILSAADRSGITPIRLPAPSPRSIASREVVPDSGGYAVAFDEPAAEIRLIWAPSARGGNVGTTKTIVYDDEGRRREYRDPLQPYGTSANDSFQQVISTDGPLRALRVIPDSTLAGLHLVGATSTKHEHKPFVDGSARQFWFIASGTPPYSLYIDRNYGLCGDYETPQKMSAYPRLHDADWPPPARVGAPLANARSPLAALAASHFGVVVWLYWLAFLIVLWLPAAAFVGARWLRVRRFEARQRRTR